MRNGREGDRQGDRSPELLHVRLRKIEEFRSILRKSWRGSGYLTEHAAVKGCERGSRRERIK